MTGEARNVARKSSGQTREGGAAGQGGGRAGARRGEPGLRRAKRVRGDVEGRGKRGDAGRENHRSGAAATERATIVASALRMRQAGRAVVDMHADLNDVAERGAQLGDHFGGRRRGRVGAGDRSENLREQREQREGDEKTAARRKRRTQPRSSYDPRRPQDGVPASVAPPPLCD